MCHGITGIAQISFKAVHLPWILLYSYSRSNVLARYVKIVHAKEAGNSKKVLEFDSQLCDQEPIRVSTDNKVQLLRYFPAPE